MGNSSISSFHPAAEAAAAAEGNARGLFLVRRAAEALLPGKSSKPSATAPTLWALSLTVALGLAGIALVAHFSVERSRAETAARNFAQISMSPGTR